MFRVPTRSRVLQFIARNPDISFEEISEKLFASDAQLCLDLLRALESEQLIESKAIILNPDTFNFFGSPGKPFEPMRRRWKYRIRFQGIEYLRSHRYEVIKDFINLISSFLPF